MEFGGDGSGGIGGRRHVRAFVCVLPGNGVIDEIAGFIGGLKNFTGFKWAARETLHITLKFLGDIAPERVTTLDTNLSRIGGARPFRITMSHVGAFPGMASPRALWLGVGEGADELSGLAASVGRAAAASGCAAEKRGFHPHLTLARARGGAGCEMPDGLARLLDECPSPSWTCGNFVLMRSELLPGGVKHTPIARYSL
jgi:2'-5' RNA ligase